MWCISCRDNLFRNTFYTMYSWKTLNDKPGPLGFRSVIRPSLKMTARSYSFTIWTLEMQPSIQIMCDYVQCWYTASRLYVCSCNMRTCSDTPTCLCSATVLLFIWSKSVTLAVSKLTLHYGTDEDERWLPSSAQRQEVRAHHTCASLSDFSLSHLIVLPITHFWFVLDDTMWHLLEPWWSHLGYSSWQNEWAFAVAMELYIFDYNKLH